MPPAFRTARRKVAGRRKFSEKIRKSTWAGPAATARIFPRDLTNYDFGIYWDVFGADRGGFGNDATLMTRELESPLHLDAWKTAPRGGEIDPTFMGEPSFNTAGLQAVVRKHASRIVDLARRLHWNHLAVLDQINRTDSELWDKASQIQNALGYRFVISEASHTAVVAAGGSLAVNVKLTNTGSSPIHYPWPLEVALADARTRKVAWRTLWDGVDPRTWLPGVPINLDGNFVPPAGLAAGPYVVTLALLDPSGLVPAARFAVHNYWMGGRTPLGPVAVGTAAPTAELNEFDDLQTDSSLYYLAAADVAPAPPGNSRLSNFSIFTSLDRPGDTFTLGYVVGGSGAGGAKPLVVRAAGPSLRPFGITNALDDPKFEVFAQNQRVGGNDNWGGTAELARAMAASGRLLLPVRTRATQPPSSPSPAARPRSMFRRSATAPVLSSPKSTSYPEATPSAGREIAPDPMRLHRSHGLIGCCGEHHHPAPTAGQRRLLTEAFRRCLPPLPPFPRHLFFCPFSREADFLSSAFDDPPPHRLRPLPSGRAHAGCRER